MKPLEKIDQLETADGRPLTLYRREGFYYIKIGGLDLMTSENHGSEEALAELAFQRTRKIKQPHVLIGGLGMGYTLRAALDLLPPGGKITVSELFPQVLRWNQEHLGHLAGNPLDDPRARVELQDIHQLLKRNAYDLILNDVDNGPGPMTQSINARLYDAKGLRRFHSALRPGGVLSVWSVQADKKFVALMKKTGFRDARCELVKARKEKGRSRYAIFLGRKAG